MESIILLVVAILPVYLIGLYVYKKDRDKESKKLLSKLFVFGIISCFPAVVLELIVGSFFSNPKTMDLITLFLYVFISIALCEELCKWFMVYKIAYRHKEFNHIYDAIVYCVFVSLGFAAFENILYVSSYGIITGLIRAISAIPGHACDAIIMGHYLGLSKVYRVNSDDKLAKKNLILSIILPAIVHAIYDYCLFTERLIFLLLFSILLIGIYVYGIKMIKKVSKIERNFIEDNTKHIVNYCSNCGALAIGKYCVTCGNYLPGNEIKNDNSLTQ